MAKTTSPGHPVDQAVSHDYINHAYGAESALAHDQTLMQSIAA